MNAESFSEALKYNSATDVFDNILIASLGHEPLVMFKTSGVVAGVDVVDGVDGVVVPVKAGVLVAFVTGNEEQRKQMKSEVRWSRCASS